MSNRNILLAAAGVSTGNPNAWDISKAYYDGPYLGDVSKAVGVNELGVGTQMATPECVVLSTDGLNSYVLDSNLDRIHQYTLPIAWYYSGVSYTNNYFSVNSQETDAQAIFFKSDGTKLYVVGTANQTVYQYSLSTAWDISTVSYDSVSKSISAQETSPTGLFFRDDGLKMYICGTAGDDVNEYTLATAWDVSSASYVQNFSVSAQETGVSGVSFTEDGLKMYIIGTSGDDVNQYSLSTAWDISTATYVTLYSVSSFTVAPKDIFMRPNGASFYITYSLNGSTVSAPAVLAFFVGGFDTLSQDTTSTGIHFKTDGTKMYMVGAASDSIYEYDLSTAWDTSTASFSQSFSVASQETTPADIYFKDDGIKMYIIGSVGDNIYEYTLSVAWDISTASFTTSFSVVTQETGATGLAFSADGTKMYATGTTSDDVHQYSLSTAWDISSASYVASTTDLIANPSSLTFKPDGTKLFISSTTTDSIQEFPLSTPWDITSIGSLSYNLITTTSAPTGIYFRPDGLQLFVIDSAIDRVLTYTISEE